MSVPPPPSRRPTVIPRHGIWHARYYGWDAGKGRWKKVGKSTRLSATDDHRPEALEVAKQWQQVAYEAAGFDGTLSDSDAGVRRARGGGLTPQRVTKSVEKIIRDAGASTARLLPRFDLFVDAWLAEKDDVNTRASYKTCADRFVEWAESVDHSSLVFVSDFDDPSMIERFRDWLVSEGMSANRTNFHLGVLNQIGYKARRFGLLSTNPAEMVKRISKRGEVDDSYAWPLTNEQYEALLAAPEETRRRMDAHWHATPRWTPEFAAEWQGVITLAGEIGSRLGDTVSFKHADFVRESQGLDYLPAKTRKRSPKRILFPLLPLAPRSWRWLEALDPSHDANAPIFPILAQERPQALSRQFNQLLDTAGITREKVVERSKRGRARYNYSFHSLRHTAITRAKTMGITEAVRMALFGHSQAVTHEIYTHWSSEELERIVRESIEE